MGLFKRHLLITHIHNTYLIYIYVCLFMGLFKRPILVTPIHNTYLINIYWCLFKRPLLITHNKRP